MRKKRAQKIRNDQYPPGDPRRWEPGQFSLKRVGDHWREHWHATLKPAKEQTEHGRQ